MFDVSGWGGFVLKEKLKLIKGSLKVWHHNHTKKLEGRIIELQDRLASLDSKGEEFDLEVDKIEELHSISANLFSLSKINTSMQWQESRIT